MQVASLVSQDVRHAEHIWRNGQIIPWTDAMVHVRAAGHSTVPAVFEGIKAYWSAGHGQLYVFRLREHMQRLLDSIKVVRLRNNWSLDDLVGGTIDTLRANQVRQDMYIRPWAFIEGIVYEQIAPANAPAEVVIDIWPFRSAMLTERGCRVCISSWTRISDNVMPPRVKAFSNYHNSRLGAIEATANGYDWPLFLNDRGKVTEGPGACVALVRHGTLITPDISSGLLESITRATILQLVGEWLGIPVVEREVERTELYLADELFYMGTGWEVLPILDVDGLPVGNGQMGPITKAIDRAYHDLVRGIDPGHEEWRTPVWP
jgi:branched-chain amino acid aminotransferase